MNQEKDPLKADALSLEKEAWNFALKILGISPKSRNEMIERLKTKGYTGGLAEKTAARLEAVGFLNDRALAAGLVARMAASRKGFGKRKAAFELKRRGFDAAAAAEALEALTGEVQKESAEVLAQALWAKTGKMPFLKRKKKLFDTLVRRGFDFGMTQQVIEKVIRDSGDKSTEDDAAEFS